MGHHFSGGLTINPARISVRLFSGLGYAPDPKQDKHFGVAALTPPTLMQSYLAGVSFVAVSTTPTPCGQDISVFFCMVLTTP